MVRNLECETRCKSCETPRPGSAEATSAAKLWTAQDFFEGVLTKKMFALKLKTSEQAQKFKKIFKEAQTKEKPKEMAKPETRTSETKSLFDRFKEVRPKKDPGSVADVSSAIRLKSLNVRLVRLANLTSP